MTDDPTQNRAEYDESVDIPLRQVCPACGTPLTDYMMEGEETKQWCDECEIEWMLDYAKNMVSRSRRSRP